MLPALADLDEVLDYISSHSQQGARNVQGRIQAVIELLVRHLYIGTDQRSRHPPHNDTALPLSHFP
jgi:plasmid stabilization system protein ParE